MPFKARSVQLVARLIAIVLLVLIGLAIKGVPSSQTAGVAPAIGGVEGGHSATRYESLQWASAYAAPMETNASVAHDGR